MVKDNKAAEGISSRLDKISRRQDSIQRSQDLLYDHLKILEDIQMAINRSESKLDIFINKHAILNKDLKADIKDVKTSTDNVIDEVAEQVVTLIDSEQPTAKPRLHERIFNRIFKSKKKGGDK